MSDKYDTAERRYRKMKLKPTAGSTKKNCKKSKTCHPNRTLRTRIRSDGLSEDGFKYWIFKGSKSVGFSNATNL